MALNVEAWAPVIMVTRVSRSQDNSPLEMTVVVSRGDRYKYQVMLPGRMRRI